MINLILWAFLAVFLLATSLIPGLAPAGTNSSQNSMGLTIAQLGTGLAWLAFLIYSVRCSMKESLVKTMKRMAGTYWGRQIGLDLYIGLIMFSAMVFAVEGSLWIGLLWLIPTLIYGNLVPLFYLATRLPQIVELIQI